MAVVQDNERLQGAELLEPRLPTGLSYVFLRRADAASGCAGGPARRRHLQAIRTLDSLPARALAVSPFTLMLPWLVTSRQRGAGPGIGAARFTNRETKARPDPPLDAPCRLALSFRAPWPEVML